MYETISLFASVMLTIIFIFIHDQIDLLFFVHLLVLCRIPRMLSGLTLYKPFRDILFVFMKLLPFCYQLGSVIFILFYCFSSMGMHIWGGKIHDGLRDELEHKLKLPNPDYVLNNFNDMMSGMITLFELLIVNNWQYNVKMYVYVSGTNYVKAFFMIWYFFAVILGLNLLVSFILEIYVTTITQAEYS